MDNRVTYQVIGYTDAECVPRVEQTALVRTTEESLARFLAGQLLMWRYLSSSRASEDSVRHCAELRRGPLERGPWTPAHHDDPVADIAYLDADTGSIEWQLNAPTYVVVTEQPRRHDTVVELPGWKR